MRTLKLYWSRSKPNFGDAMSPILCERLAGCPVVYAERRRCDLVAIGSLMGRFRECLFHPRVHVWGTGFIEEQPPRKSRFYYHALRGRHSARIVRSLELDVFGDPGLLADMLWPEFKIIAKSHRVGIVPHYEDREDPQVEAMAARLPHSVVIDVFRDVKDVLRQIAGCECILSSSLHGLVVADAFGVPNAWIKMSNKVRGNDFKFRDYYSVFGLDANVSPTSPERIDTPALDRIVETYGRPGLAEVKRKLVEAFPFKASGRL